MIQVNAIGDACPIPVVKTKNAIRDLNGAGVVETLVDNEIAVQNLMKMAQQKGYAAQSETLGENAYKVTMIVGEGAALPAENEPTVCEILPPKKKNITVVISTGKMGGGSDELGKTLLKGFIYALTQQDVLPTTMLFYNGGASVTCEESPSLDDLRLLAEQGVEILTCGTCLNYYGLSDKLKIGDVTNMYVICEKMMNADLIVTP